MNGIDSLIAATTTVPALSNGTLDALTIGTVTVAAVIKVTTWVKLALVALAQRFGKTLEIKEYWGWILTYLVTLGLMIGAQMISNSDSNIIFGELSKKALIFAIISVGGYNGFTKLKIGGSAGDRFAKRIL